MSIFRHNSFLRAMRAPGRIHDLCVYAGFVLVAAVFWCILTLNEDAQTDFDVRVKIAGMPDSVTLITDPPKVIHVNVRDRGSHLLRLLLLHDSEIRLDFKEFASDGKFSVSPKAMLTHIRAIFGKGATLSIISDDSISVPYTTVPGKYVPVRIDADISPALGKVVSHNLRSSTRKVKVFAVKGIIDTLSYVSTMPIERRDVSDSFTVNVQLKSIKGVRMEPSSVKVTVPIEPLENRRALVSIRQINVPTGQSLILFPDKTEINYLVPMSRGNVSPAAFNVTADYRSITSPSAQRMPIKISGVPQGVTGATLTTDSVEFTIIRHVPAK